MFITSLNLGIKLNSLWCKCLAVILSLPNNDFNNAVLNNIRFGGSLALQNLHPAGRYNILCPICMAGINALFALWYVHPFPCLVLPEIAVHGNAGLIFPLPEFPYISILFHALRYMLFFPPTVRNIVNAVLVIKFLSLRILVTVVMN